MKLKTGLPAKRTWQVPLMIHSLNKYLQSSYYLTAVLGTGNRTLRKTNEAPLPRADNNSNSKRMPQLGNGKVYRRRRSGTRGWGDEIHEGRASAETPRENSTVDHDGGSERPPAHGMVTRRLSGGGYPGSLINLRFEVQGAGRGGSSISRIKLYGLLVTLSTKFRGVPPEKFGKETPCPS